MSLILQFVLPLCSAECPRAGGTAALALGGLSQNLSCRKPSLASAEGSAPNPDLSLGWGRHREPVNTVGAAGVPQPSARGGRWLIAPLANPLVSPLEGPGNPGRGGCGIPQTVPSGGRGVCMTLPSMQIKVWRLAGGRGQALQRGYKSGGETMHRPSRLGAWCGWEPQHRARWAHRGWGLPTFIYGAEGTPFVSRAADRNEWCPLFCLLSPPSPPCRDGV